MSVNERLRPLTINIIDGCKTGNDIKSIARDAAVLLTFALQATAFLMKQFATPSPTVRDGRPASILGAVVKFYHNEIIFGRRLMDVGREDFSDAANWQIPQTLPDLRRVGIVALNTETNDEG